MFFCILVWASLIAALAYWSIKPLKYWASLGVKQDPLGTLLVYNWGTLIKKQSFASFVQSLYNSHSNVRYIGTYQLNTPTLLIKDPDLIKLITVKDFDHFTDHRTFIPEDSDPLWAKNLFALTGKRWRDMRSTLSPCFTSAKMKIIFKLMLDASEDFIHYFKNLDEDEVEVELKDTFTRFANDVIATTAFGIKVDSLKEKDNQFYLMGKRLTDLMSFRRMAKLMTFLIFPKIAKIMKLSFFEDDVKRFFFDLVKETIRAREERNIIRPDVIHLLMEARKERLEEDPIKDSLKKDSFIKDPINEDQINKDPINKDLVQKDPVKTDPVNKDPKNENPVQEDLSKGSFCSLTDEDIAAQAMIFFFAGFETVSSLMTFLGYEMAVNPDIQNRLREEIRDTLNQTNGQLTYEGLLKMKYLDMVVSETLRKWPINVAIDRSCTKPYTIVARDEDEVDLHLPQDNNVWLPVFAIHRDPKHYPDPEKFDPERFNDENKAKINPYAYLPFGLGPRICLGSRFALLEVKTVFVHILTSFEIVPSAKSVIPMKLSEKEYILKPQNGFWCGLKRL